MTAVADTRLPRAMAIRGILEHSHMQHQPLLLLSNVWKQVATC